MKPAVSPPITASLRYKVNKRTGCWEWTGPLNQGYGMVRFAGKSWHAHRMAYWLLVGNLRPEQVVDHLCRVRHCINPVHLEAVSSRTNLLRGNGWGGRNARKTHCPRGHEYNKKNTYVPPNGRGRDCLRCVPLRLRERLGEEGLRDYYRERSRLHRERVKVQREGACRTR